MTKTRRLFLIGACVLSAISASAFADVKPASLFTDHMVLQREKPVAVWGMADAGEEVTVTFAGQTKKAVAADDGRWKLALDALQASDQPAEMTIAGKNSIKLSDVLVGEVWLCSGQSNMEFRIDQLKDGKAETENANYPTIRLFNVSAKKHPSAKPTDILIEPVLWTSCNPDDAKGFSAVGYYFGRDLSEHLHVPIGLINSSWGGMPAEAFTSVDDLTGDLHGLIDQWDQRLAHYDQDMVDYNAKYEAWQREAVAANAKKEKPPVEPQKPKGPNAPERPGNLWNGIIRPLVPYSIRGVIWYQGETNAGSTERAKQYEPLLTTMITSWRTHFGQGDTPFLIVQLANFMATTSDANKVSAWGQLRESQRQVSLKVPDVGQAVIIDIGDAKDIHPKDKLDVGKRLALLALADTYGVKDLVKQGPTPASAEFGSSGVVIHFKDVGGGLIAKGSLDHAFCVSAETTGWEWVPAKIDGDTVVLDSIDVKEPTKVRYAWADNPKSPLFNKEGLPATPFEMSKP